MSDVSERIKSVRRTLNFTQAEMSEKIGVSQTVVSQYERGGAKPEYDVLLKIAEIGKVSLDWLLTGRESLTPSVASPSAAEFGITEAPGSWFPVVGRVTAGDYQIFEGNVVEEIWLPILIKNGKFACIIEGDSMDAGDYPLQNGDYVLMDPEQTAYPGDIVVVVTSDGRQMVKQLGTVSEKGIELLSFNPSFQPILVPVECKILRVVYHQPRGRKL